MDLQCFNGGLGNDGGGIDAGLRQKYSPSVH
jgi:hypothetical protein